MSRGLEGTYLPKGMSCFDDVLSARDAAAIHAYVIDQAWLAYEAEHAAAAR